MKLQRKYFAITMLFVIVITMFISLPRVSATSYNVYTVKYECSVRTSASDKVSAIKNGNDDVKVYPNQQLEYIKNAYGPNNGKSNQEWYAVKFDYAAREYTGYVAKACMYDTKTYSYSDDSSFESSISSFPDSYKPYLRKLHAIHPNWTFKADYTNLDWETSADAESQTGVSAISSLYPSLKFTNNLYPNGIVIDGNSWYAAAKDAVKYYMDSRNFLNEKNIFMFQSLSYNSSQDSSVQGILSSSFMASSFTENGVTKTYANAFIEAGKQSGVSSTYLATLALQEMGTTKSAAASGTVSGYEGYYNFYNIGAYSGEDNYLKGLQYAKNNGWNGIQKAITAGANEIAKNYISKGQDTMYFKKFNVSSYHSGHNTYTHQYQTNIMAPYSESSNMYNTLKSDGKINSSYTFVIPVYNNRTNSAFKVSSTDTIGGSTKPTVDTNQGGNSNNNSSNTLSTSQKIANSGYSVLSGYFGKVNFGTNVSSLLTNLKNKGVSASYSKNSGNVGTGDMIKVDNNSYQVVVYGDLSGDGIVSALDLMLTRKYLIGQKDLSGSYKTAADVNKDGKVSALDLMLIKKQLLNTYSITQ